MLISALPALTSISAFLGLACKAQAIVSSNEKLFRTLQKVSKNQEANTWQEVHLLEPARAINGEITLFRIVQQFLQQNEQTLRSLGYRI